MQYKYIIAHLKKLALNGDRSRNFGVTYAVLDWKILIKVFQVYSFLLNM